MKRKLNRRLARLEETVDMHQEATFHFADGSTETIAGGRHPLDLLSCALGHKDVPADHARELELLRKSVRIEEPRGGLILELTQAILQSPRTAVAPRGP
jgi:hypothetical protein